jgi:shikimate kinase
MDADSPTPRARVVFIGPMGAGKTTIGKRVAKLLAAPFLDSDTEFVKRHGPIAAFFDTHGEAAFRLQERVVVAESVATDAVVALGGGAVLDPDTRADLAGVPVVLLTTTAEAVANRIGNGKRPLVRGGVADWTRIHESRRAIYESLADLTIDTSRRPIAVIAAETADWVRAQSTTSLSTGRTS